MLKILLAILGILSFILYFPPVEGMPERVKPYFLIVSIIMFLLYVLMDGIAIGNERNFIKRMVFSGLSDMCNAVGYNSKHLIESFTNSAKLLSWALVANVGDALVRYRDLPPKKLGLERKRAIKDADKVIELRDEVFKSIDDKEIIYKDLLKEDVDTIMMLYYTKSLHTAKYMEDLIEDKVKVAQRIENAGRSYIKDIRTESQLEGISGQGDGITLAK